MARFKHRPVSNDAGCVKAITPASGTAVVAVAATPQRRRRGRTNSERGRAYRKRQEEETARLEAQVVALRAAVQEKQFLRGVWEAKYLRSRHSLDGSRVAAVREYHALLRHGLSAGGAHRLQQEAFVYSIMDPDVDIGWHGVNGPRAVLGQWRLHTSAFARYSGELVGEPAVVGSPECPLVQVRVDVHALVGEPTVMGLFPLSSRDAARRLLGKCMNTLVRFSCRSSFQFTREGRVNFLLVQIDYADGFVAAGMELTGVAELLKLSAITPLSTIALAPSASSSANRSAK